MILIFCEEDGDQIIEADEEGIDYLIEGLEALRKSAPADTVETPFLSEDGVGTLILRHPDEDS